LKVSRPKWQELSFLDNLNSAALYLGYANLPLAWGLAKVNWRSVDEREDFLKTLVDIPGGEP
jgi:hypothetical protein